MKKIVGYCLVFVLVFLTSVLVYLPAHIVVKHLPLPAQLSLSGVQGTIWQGSAEQVRWQQKNWGDLRWDVYFSALARMKVEAAIRFGRNSEMNLHGKGNVGYGLDGVYAINVVASLPADEALKQFPVALPVVAKGLLELSVKEYVYQAPYCLSAEGSLVWSTGSVGSPLGSLSLGQTMADLHCQNSTLNVKGSQKTVQVVSEFSAQLNPNRSYQAQGWFTPGTEFPQGLNNQLKWLPKPDAKGRYMFNRQGRL